MAYCSKGRVCITMRKTSQLKSNVDVTTKENFNLSDALESVYPLLEIVFSYLDYNDLQRAALVKKSWQMTANKILEKRNEVSWITVFRKKRQSCIHYSTNYPYNNINIGIILFNYRAVSLSDFFCCHDNLSQRKIKFADFLADQVVPNGTKYCVIGCPGVASMFSKKVVNFKSSVPLFDSCFIPAIPNVQISMFYCNPVHMKDTYIKDNGKLKCLLLFCKHDLEDNIYKIFEHLLPEHDFQNVAVGGGIIRRTLLFPQVSDGYKFRKFNLCIAFTEDNYCDSMFNASSVVISGNNLTSENFEEQLLKFKNRILIRSNSLAFRICCSAKMRKNHESRIFNKLFPETPLLGLEAEGEIGWNCFNISDNIDDLELHKPKKTREGYPVVQHQWSTVIVFVTWGHLLKKN